MTIRARTDLIVIHCSATRGRLPVTAAQIRAWHRARGWSDIGYHRVIARDGTVEAGRPLDAVGAHVAGHNARSVGVCLVGGLDDRTGAPVDNFTPAQWDALRRVVAGLLARYPGARILGHRDLSPDRDRDGVVEPGEWLKACPCFDARAWAHREGLPAADEAVPEGARA
jgi:N-acetyl-anhydromuramyl-L-alanine amidase AmpD